MSRTTIVVLDAEDSLLESARAVFAGRDFDIAAVASAGKALDVLRTAGASVLIADARLLGDDPSDWIARATRLRPALVPILLASPGGGRRQGIRGVFDVLDRPLSVAALRRAGDRAVEHHQLLDQVHALRRALKGRAGFAGIIGRSAAAERLRERIERVAPGSDAVLFVGESGTGRETAARLLHEASPRGGRPFVAVDLAANPGDPISASALAAASEGTLYLEGVGDLPPAGQGALLARLAGAANVRLTACASTDLSQAVALGLFREDLRARLAQTKIEVPPLRDRREDIALLARHAAETIREINALGEIRFAPETLDRLEGYDWPGNLRELAHAVEYALTVCENGVVRPRDLPEGPRGGDAPERDSPSDHRFREAKRTVVDAFEQAYLEDLLRRHRGNVTSAASQSGMLRSALQRLLRKHDLRSSDFRLEERASTRDRSS